MIRGVVPLTWRPSNRDGTFGEPVTVDVPVAEADSLRALLDQAEHATGEARTAMLSEFRTRMDLIAMLDAGPAE